MLLPFSCKSFNYIVILLTATVIASIVSAAAMDPWEDLPLILNDGGGGMMLVAADYKAIVDYPSDGSVDVPLGAPDNRVTLSWFPGQSAIKHRLYLGTSQTLGSNDFVVEIVDSSSSVISRPVTNLLEGTTYYWRVDELRYCNGYNSSGGYLTQRGDVWSFVTEDNCISATKASNPFPLDNAVAIQFASDLSWNPGNLAISHDVYFGDNYDAVNLAVNPNVWPGQGNQTECSFDPGPLTPGVQYYWRINERNNAQACEYITVGDIWSFRVANRWYVDNSRPGGVGTSWDEAFNSLQGALDAASDGDEIWVAKGKEPYIPTLGTSDDPRSKTFKIPSGVSIYGGFFGNEENLSDRRWKSYITILSGDINDDDIDGIGKDENCYSVVTVTGAKNSLLDGFTIEGGKGPVGCGIFCGNEATGALFTLKNSIIIDNNAEWAGGALYCDDASSLINVEDCDFTQNTAQLGGAIFIMNSNLTISRSSISQNIADIDGGGFYSQDSSIDIYSVNISGNKALGTSSPLGGGGMLINNSEIIMANCLVEGNLSNQNGGGIYLYSERNLPTQFINCSIAGNKTLGEGGGLYNKKVNGFELKNTVIWGNYSQVSGNSLANEDGNKPNISYCDIEGCGSSGAGWTNSMGYDGGGNIDADPKFILAGNWDDNGTPSDYSDDTWNQGDYRPDYINNSPCIDAGGEVAIVDDIVGVLRPFDFPEVDNNGALDDYDIGAYEADLEKFRFTVASDIRPAENANNRTNWQHFLSEVTRHYGNEGKFLVGVGDTDYAGDTYGDVVNEFGAQTLYYPVVGEHDASSGTDITWIRSYYDSDLAGYVNPGPVNGVETSYSWDYGYAHFIVLNEYYNGTSDTGADGDICDSLYNWLEADLAANTKDVIVVFGHEPAYPFVNYVGDSLDKYLANRDRFWGLLELYDVDAFIAGHTHYYEIHRPNGSGGTLHVNTGSAGQTPSCPEGKYTVLNVEATKDCVNIIPLRGTNDLDITNECPLAYDITDVNVTDGSMVWITLEADDFNGDSLEYFNSDPRFGVITSDPDGTPEVFKYTPSSNITFDQAGEAFDSFTYYVNDGQCDSNIATVNIKIKRSNRPPIVCGGTEYCNINSSYSVSFDLVQDLYASDLDGDQLFFEITSLPAEGTLDYSQLPAITYTADADSQVGEVFSFDYSANDGIEGRSATIYIEITDNDPPVIVNNPLCITVDEDSFVDIDLGLSGAYDPDGTTINFYIPGASELSEEPGPFLCEAGGFEKIDEGVYRYTPKHNEFGEDYFFYKAIDEDNLKKIGRVDIVINPVNDAPVISPATDNINIPTSVTAEGYQFKLNATDVDGDILEYYIDSAPENGVYDLPDSSSPWITYYPNLDELRDDYFKYHVYDGQLPSNQGAYNIFIRDEYPCVVDMQFRTDEDTAVQIDLEAWSCSDPDKKVVTNYTYVINKQPLNGILEITPESEHDIYERNYIYTPNPDWHGEDEFEFYAKDGTNTLSNIGIVKITVDPVNDAPIAYSFKKGCNQNRSRQFELEGSDIDSFGLNYSLDTGPSNGTVIINGPYCKYIPNAGYLGDDTFTYYIDDGELQSASETVTMHVVTDMGHEPVADEQELFVDEDNPLSVILSATDQDGDSLIYSIVRYPEVQDGTLTPNGYDYAWIFTPSQDFNGSTSFEFKVSDGLSDDFATVIINVNPVNDPPVAQDLYYYPDINTGVSGPLLAYDADGDNNITYELETYPANGTVYKTGDNFFVYTPNHDFSGWDAFTYHASDGIEDGPSATVHIKVLAPGEGVPVVYPIDKTTDEDIPVEITLWGFDANRQRITFTVNNPSNGTLYQHASKEGVYLYRPNSDWNGVDTFTYQGTDTDGNTSASALVTITVLAINDAPRANWPYEIVELGASVPITLSAVDPDGDTSFTYFLVEPDPQLGTLSGAEPSLSYTADKGRLGADRFGFRVTDGLKTSSKAFGQIYIVPIGGSYETKLTSSDGSLNDFFGRSVDIDGTTAVVGAYSADNNGSNSGSVYVYSLNGSNWIETELSSSASPSDAFGYSVAVDGDTLAVGAPNGNAVHVYIRAGSAWLFQQKLTRSSGNFGISVDIDGDTLIAGCYNEDTDSDGDGDGAAYIYTRSGSSWTYQKRLIAPSPSPDNASNKYGYSVAIDNGTAVVGSYQYNYSGVTYTGAAWVYTGSGSSWTSQGDLSALAGSYLQMNDNFGWSVAVDGDTILVGAHRDNDQAVDAGCVFVFERNGSTWSRQDVLYSSNPGSGSFFGCSVSLSGDRAFIGSYEDLVDGETLGTVYEFVRSVSVWSEENSFRPSAVDKGDLYGYNLAQTESFVIVSSHMDDEEAGNAGAAYIYDLGYITKTFNPFQINAYLDSSQQEPAIASNSKDMYVVVWERRGQGGDWFGVYGQLYDKNGLRIGDEFQINATTVAFQCLPDVSMNAEGNFVVTWKATGSSGDSDIIGRLFDPNGMPLTGEILVNTYTNSFQEDPAVSINDSGNFVVVWESDRGTYQHARSICGRSFDKYGNPVSGEIVIGDVSSDFPDVCLGQSGEFVVVWHNWNVSSDERNIFIRRYYSNAIPKEKAVIVNTSSLQAISEPKIDFKINGEIVVVWHHGLNNFTESSILCQHFNSDGSKFGGEYIINEPETVSFGPSITVLNEGSIAVAWETKDGTNGRETWICQYESNGSVLSDDRVRINNYTTGDQYSTDIASVGDRYFVVWEGDGKDGSETGVFGALGSATYLGDFDFSGQVDIADLVMLAQQWLSNEPVLDIAPDSGDGVINLLDYSRLFEEGLYNWTSSADF